MTNGESGGQVSEMSEGAGEEEAPGDSVAAHPDDAEADRTDEGPQGPDARAQDGERPLEEDN